ncbi:MAG: hypothetical protein ACTSWN_10610 [Promethearchaeota archaeon]
MKINGYFNSFLKEIAKTINDKFPEDAIIEVKNIRRVLGIPSGNRSKTAFISRALRKLCEYGCIDYDGKSGTHKYKKRGKIDISIFNREYSGHERPI